ncbi:polysaccharide biosynthesis/export family protein [Flavobacterium sp. RSB2_4_14]|uniref:polysaccharide biosynthesis/export family protein n=1 Tax=Flavobacterium sp. RSB2_4_14 TaxID=3447665 RepID=UPI003F35490A
MKNPKIHFIFLISILFASCVPTKDLIYLQDNGNTKNEVVTSSNQKPYRLQTNDILSVTIKAIDPKLVDIFNSSGSQTTANTSAESNYFNGYTVDDHGNIRLPILGEINVLGYTAEEVRVAIEKMLNEKYFKTEAGIFVVVKLAGFRYSINGEVGSTGTKIIYQEKVNIMEAIANAGDITVVGDRKDVKIIRMYPQGSETFSIDLTDKNAVNSTAFYLQPNDYIYVKPLKQKSWGTGTTGIQSLTTIITVLSLITTTLLLIQL